MPPIFDEHYAVQTVPTKRRKLEGSCLPGFCHGLFFDSPMTLQDASSLSLPQIPKEMNRSPTQEGDIDQMLAAEMYKLSVKEREEVYDDVHGTSELVLESPAFLEAKLREFASEVELVRERDKSAYNEAMTSNSKFVSDPKFHLMFLRGKQFDAKEAARQMVNHFDTKRRLFGVEKLGRPIKYSDLSVSDKASIDEGSMHTLSRPDNVGRSIFCVYIHKMKGPPLGTARMLFYHIMCLLENEETQRKGALLLYWMDPSSFSVAQSDLEAWQTGTEVMHSVPLRPVGLHYCGHGSSMHPGVQVGLRLACRQMKVRFRCHLGSPMECVYALVAYGITRDSLPFDNQGKLVLDNYRDWVKMRAALEQGRSLGSESVFNDISCDPATHTEMDVLMGGNAKEVLSNPGNIAFRKLLELHSVEYNSTTSRKTKGSICQAIIRSVREQGGRFMTRDAAKHWKEIEDEAAHVKISHAFRNRKRPKKDTK